METPFAVELIGTGIALVLGAALFGFLLQRTFGLILLGGAGLLAAGLSAAGAVLGGWIGLFLAIVIVALLAAGLGTKLGKNRGAWFFVSLWLGFCLTCLIGYWVGGSIGLLAITLPANILFWTTLYICSGFLLPLKEGHERGMAFRSLLTFSLGTNYPYYVTKDRKLETRVPGSPYRSFFGGPGIVLTDCAHLAVITDGTNIQLPEEPGLTFTGRFEIVQSIIDLRPQLRSFYVEARTLDGISVRVLTFIPFRFHWGGQVPEPGKSFPYQRRAVLRVTTSEIFEQHQNEKHDWDKLVQIDATRIMRDIVSRYSFDDLCLALGPCVAGPQEISIRYQGDKEAAPHDPKHDPRYRIRNELVSRLREEMKKLGIEVLGGGISNLEPVDEEPTKQRVENWKKKWQNRRIQIEAQAAAKRTQLMTEASVGVEQDLLVTVSRFLSESLAEGKDMTDELLAATLVASLEKMADNHRVQEELTDDTKRRLVYLGSQGKLLPK